MMNSLLERSICENKYYKEYITFISNLLNINRFEINKLMYEIGICNTTISTILEDIVARKNLLIENYKKLEEEYNEIKELIVKNNKIIEKGDILSQHVFEEYKLEPLSITNNILCKSCCTKINSTTHIENCITIYMNNRAISQKITVPMQFKPMMTYGLRGSTAIVIVIIEKETGKYLNIIFAHNSSKQKIINIFLKYYNTNYDFFILVKAPGIYVKKSSNKYIFKVEEEELITYFINGENIKLCLFPYNVKKDSYGSPYKRTLYISFDNKQLRYSDNYYKYNIIP